jgi:pyruvate dehydrogenase E2 component (dihydrolipoamide acetyltransferase)
MSEAYTVKPLTPLRKIIAARMVCDFEVDRLLARRQHANAAAGATKISLNDCIVKACASALMEHADLNIQVIGNEIHQYRDADIAVIVAVDGGLSTPVIRGANRKSVQEIAVEMKQLAASAASGRLSMKQILGGSFSISNLGGYGVEEFDAIINPPQGAILAVGSAKARPIVGGSGEVRVATMLRATLSADHRALDGVACAAFLATLRRVIEQPQQLFAD